MPTSDQSTDDFDDRDSRPWTAPNTMRIDRPGLILEFAAEALRLHWRMRSEGLLAHAVVEVSRESLDRFILALGTLLEARVGRATLVGEGAPASTLVVDASVADVPPRLTIRACPAAPLQGKVVLEAVELSRTDLIELRQWAADCRDVRP